MDPTERKNKALNILKRILEDEDSCVRRISHRNWNDGAPLETCPEAHIPEKETPDFVVTLPDGCAAGRAEGIEHFARFFSLIQQAHPEARFQIVPESSSATSWPTNWDESSSPPPSGFSFESYMLISEAR